MTKTSARYSPEVRARAVRMVLDHQADRSLGPVAFGASLNKIKRYRRIVLRCEKTIASFRAFVMIACTMVWLA